MTLCMKRQKSGFRLALSKTERVSSFTRCLNEPGVAIAASTNASKLHEPTLHERLKHTILAAVEVIQRRLGDARSFANLPDRGRVVAFDGEKVEGGAEDPLG